MWSSYPIEKQAYNSYTRDLYEKFRDEFQLTTRYNVRPHGEHLYELYPNQEWVAKYGSRSYFVTVETSAGDYRCECCKFHRDGMLCCHILKVFNHLGVDEIPTQYIKRRWTPLAITDAPPAVEDKPDELPEQSKKELRHANLMMDFGGLAKVASASDAATNIVKKHMRGARHEIKNLSLSRKKKTAAPPSGPTGGPPPSAGGPVPPMTNASASSGNAPPQAAQAPASARQRQTISAQQPKNATSLPTNSMGQGVHPHAAVGGASVHKGSAVPSSCAAGHPSGAAPQTRGPAPQLLATPTLNSGPGQKLRGAPRQLFRPGTLTIEPEPTTMRAPQTTYWPALPLRGDAPPSMVTTRADMSRLTNAGLAAFPTDSATIACASGLYITSTTVQQAHVAPVSSSLAQPPGGHARQPLNMESLRAAVAAAQGGSTTPDTRVPRDPPKSTTKGRTKSKRLQSALELHPKRKNKCSYCGSYNHNSALCPTRLA